MIVTTIHNLTPGNYTVTFTLSGYHDMICDISVLSDGTVICNASTVCGCTSSPPGLVIVGNVVTGYLLAEDLPTPTPSPITPTPTPPAPTPTPAPVADINSWIENKGGSAGLYGNYQAVAEIIDAHIGLTDPGFVVTGQDVALVIDYVLGLR